MTEIGLPGAIETGFSEFLIAGKPDPTNYCKEWAVNYAIE
jgi:hypothetical protein